VTLKRIAALVYSVLTAAVVVFQLALAGGAPWGSYAMGGTAQGTFPAALRVTAIVQAIVLGILAAVVPSRAGVLLPRWRRLSRWAVWVAVAFSAVSLLLNLITPSAGERMVWAPVAFLMLASSLVVAVGKPTPAKVVPD
jgi:hypothetical protein